MQVFLGVPALYLKLVRVRLLGETVTSKWDESVSATEGSVIDSGLSA